MLPPRPLGPPASCVSPLTSDDSLAATTTYVGTYPPLYYALVGWPSRLAGPRTSIYAMRLVSSLLVAAALASAAAALLRAGGTATTLGVAALAVTPAVLLLAGSVNPNGLELAVAAWAWAALLELAARPPPVPTPSIVRAAVAVGALCALRPLSPAFALTVVAVVAVAAGVARDRDLVRDRRFRLGAAGVAVAIAVSVTYVVLADSFEVIEFPSPDGFTRFDFAWEQLQSVPRLQQQSVGLLSWVGPAELFVPRGLIVAWLALTTAFAGMALVLGAWRERVALLLAVAATIFLPVAAGYVAETQSWQGRYTLPLSVGVPIISAWILGRRRAPLSRSVGVATAAAAAAVWVVGFERLLTRSLVGLPNRRFSGALHAPWAGPVPPWALHGAMVVAAIALPVGIVILGRAPRSPPSDGGDADATGAERESRVAARAPRDQSPSVDPA